MKNSFDFEKLPMMGKITFFFLGVGSLVGWNAILTGLDFFSDKFDGHDVSFMFSIPMFIATNVINLIMHHLSRIMSMKSRIIVGLLGQIVLLVILPIQAYLMSSDNGFYLAMLLIFIEGCAISIQQSSSVAFASMCSYQFVSIFFTGTGIGGVIICSVRLVILGSLGSDDDSAIFLGTLIYFIIAAIMLVVSIVLFLMFYTTKYCQYYLNKSKIRSISKIDNIVDQLIAGPIEPGINKNDLIKENEDYEQDNLNENNEGFLKKENNDGTTDISNVSYAIASNIEPQIKVEEEPVEIEDSKKIIVFNVFKKILPMPILVFLIYVQTFMLFPGVALKSSIDGINFAWSATIIILTYNLGDTIGKYLAGYRGYNKLKATLLILFRFVFYLFFLLLAVDTIHASWFVIFNMFIFALSNGYATCAVMVLAPDAAGKNEKETAGFIMNNGLYLGMMIGSFLALVFKNVGN